MNSISYPRLVNLLGDFAPGYRNAVRRNTPRDYSTHDMPGSGEVGSLTHHGPTFENTLVRFRGRDVSFCEYVDKFLLDSERVWNASTSLEMGIVHESDLLSAAGHLSNAADNLRAVGLVRLAAEIDSLIAMLDVEILLGTLRND